MYSNSKEKKIVQILIKKGSELLRQPRKKINFTTDIGTNSATITDTEIDEAENLINNLEKFPHAFVLGCIMDRQIRSERAWLIPYKISQTIGGFELSRLLELKQEELKKIFVNNHLHWLNK